MNEFLDDIKLLLVISFTAFCTSSSIVFGTDVVLEHIADSEVGFTSNLFNLMVCLTGTYFGIFEILKISRNKSNNENETE